MRPTRRRNELLRRDLGLRGQIPVRRPALRLARSRAVSDGTDVAGANSSPEQPPRWDGVNIYFSLMAWLRFRLE